MTMQNDMLQLISAWLRNIANIMHCAVTIHVMKNQWQIPGCCCFPKLCCFFPSKSWPVVMDIRWFDSANYVICCSIVKKKEYFCLFIICYEMSWKQINVLYNYLLVIHHLDSFQRVLQMSYLISWKLPELVGARLLRFATSSDQRPMGNGWWEMLVACWLDQLRGP